MLMFVLPDFICLPQQRASRRLVDCSSGSVIVNTSGFMLQAASGMTSSRLATGGGVCPSHGEAFDLLKTVSGSVSLLHIRCSPSLACSCLHKDP